ncbi:MULTISPECIES: hypothetical protein [Streptomyces]|uniref:hypothetical protein n=1 Tax=Streptomyces TaxID=1883 RepID=UPI00224E2F18|nr:MULTISPECIES: hypothetical protein [unclassified Streptomyces]WTB60024.1 hypothetical protein OG832_00885 [Streptomyces sp. NBC_00826]WTH95931.1 hypothetical protein OIC43_42795 [Streptomyces sp. NBC_00825]WTI04651.1 hypothetical protein OHA23_42770 [Streptomyces sp. NBC_00822]MCX4869577.1 hypothetical protein [Streptomyces sp. NBC_00906]MCX4900816.1 hypothetical protein [Streptomyces sp. NBC_00892]
MGFSRVYSTFAERGLTDDLTFIGSGRLALPETTDRFSTSKRFIDPSSVRSSQDTGQFCDVRSVIRKARCADASRRSAVPVGL